MPAVSERGFTASDLSSVAKALETYAGEIERLSQEMRAAKIETLTVKGVAELKRADERIGIFCDNVRQSLRRETRPKMFGVEIPGTDEENPQPRRGRPPKKKKS